MYLRPRVIGNFKATSNQREKPKRRRETDSQSHLSDIRKCRCCVPVCHSENVQAHHLKSTGERGTAMRSPDRFAVPLCHDHHINGVELVGSKNELDWFNVKGIKALQLAADLWASRGRLDRMQKIVIEYRFRAEEQ